MGLASSFLQWIPNASINDSQMPSASLNAQKWQALAEAKRHRTPLIIYSSPEHSDRGHQSLILKINQKDATCSIDIPHPSLPSDHLSLPKRIYAVIKQPGSYRHWTIEGQLVERAQASDGPYFKLSINDMQFCDDRRRQKRFNFKENTAEICCTPPMEPPIYGDLDNISLGGMCFSARGNLQQSDAFYMAYHSRKTAIPVAVQLNSDDKLNVELEVLSMQVIKKPYLHTRIRAKFKQLTPSQEHILAALAQKSVEVA